MLLCKERLPEGQCETKKLHGKLKGHGKKGELWNLTEEEEQNQYYGVSLEGKQDGRKRPVYF